MKTLAFSMCSLSLLISSAYASEKKDSSIQGWSKFSQVTAKLASEVFTMHTQVYSNSEMAQLLKDSQAHGEHFQKALVNLELSERLTTKYVHVYKQQFPKDSVSDKVLLKRARSIVKELVRDNVMLDCFNLDQPASDKRSENHDNKCVLL